MLPRTNVQQLVARAIPEGDPVSVLLYLLERTLITQSPVTLALSCKSDPRYSPAADRCSRSRGWRVAWAFSSMDC